MLGKPVRFRRGPATVFGLCPTLQPLREREGGWGEEYLERGFGTTSGFTEYYGGYARITYQILEPVTIFAGGSYRHDKDELNIRSDVVRANGGFTWTFLRWFSLTVSYTYAERNDDIELDSYTDNRVTATLTAAKPFRW